MEQQQKNTSGTPERNNPQNNNENLNDQVQNSATGQKKANNRNDGNDRGISAMNGDNMEQSENEGLKEYQKLEKDSMDMNKENSRH